MKESMSIAQLIAETKRLDRVMQEARDGLSFVTFYRKDKPFKNGRTIEEHEAKMKADIQSYMDNQRRLFAIKSALNKANRETELEVPAMPLLLNFVNDSYDENQTEKITIAEAINRKIFFNNILINEAKSLVRVYNRDLSNKASVDKEAELYVREQLEKQFPAEMKQTWSVEKYNEAKKRETENAEVIRLDPANVVSTEAVTKYMNAVLKYLSTIDTLLSQVNASTTVEVEY